MQAYLTDSLDAEEVKQINKEIIFRLHFRRDLKTPGGIDQTSYEVVVFKRKMDFIHSSEVFHITTNYS
jgi:hypothetical protein